ncbi:MAG: helix-turn-helix domain-containing protein [Bryobacteraceae bacterium]
MLTLTDGDLLNRLKNCEDAFVERKTAADSKDWLKTVVAFANSTPIGFPAVLFIGARDDGTIEDATTGFDSLQKKFNRTIQEQAYPAIYYLTRLLDDGGKQCLAVIIPGSADRPHFAGPSYVRFGSETKVASESQFDSLIAERHSKPYEILKWKGKQITVAYMNTGHKAVVMGAIDTTDLLIVTECNPFYITLQKVPPQQVCVPLNRINISFDTDKNHLMLEVVPA